MVTFQVTSDKRASEFDEAFDDDRWTRGPLFTELLTRVPTRPPVVVQHDATVDTAIDAMNEQHVGCALVVKEGRLVGIFTERDVLTRVVGKVRVDRTAVSQVMTADPDTLPGNASVAYALHYMSVEEFRQVPLVDGEHRPIGVVGVRDIVKWICEMFPKSVLNLPPTPQDQLTLDGG